MSENQPLIYPECPVCEVNTDENGIGLEDMTLGMFLLKCSQCGSRSEGHFNVNDAKVHWVQVDVSFWKYLVLKVLGGY